jgi:hypothetical protein
MYKQNLRLIKKKNLNIKNNLKGKKRKENTIWPKNILNNFCKFDLEKKKKTTTMLELYKNAQW